MTPAALPFPVLRSEERKIHVLILIIILVLVLGGGGGYYGHSRWGYGGGAGIGLGTILFSLLVAYMLGIFHGGEARHPTFHKDQFLICGSSKAELPSWNCSGPVPSMTAPTRRSEFQSVVHVVARPFTFPRGR